MRVTELIMLQQGTRHADALIHEKHDFTEALVVARSVHAELTAVGEVSAHVEWLLALALDMTGDSLDAIEHIERAHAIDALNPAYVSSRRVIYQRLRKQLLDLDAEADGDALPRLYATLADRGEADWDSHVHMARWLAAQGRTYEMRCLLDAVTLLYPGCEDAWAGLLALAKDAKDTTLEITARAGLSAASVRAPGTRPKTSA